MMAMADNDDVVNWLTGVDLDAMVLRNADADTRAAFLGVFSANTLPLQCNKLPALLIVNSDTANLDGQHWYAIHIAAGTGQPEGELFDPLALPQQFTPFLESWLNSKTTNWIYNDIRVQHPLIPSCGAFVLHFVLNRLQYTTMKSYMLQSFFPAAAADDIVKNELLIRNYVSGLLK